MIQIKDQVGRYISLERVIEESKLELLVQLVTPPCVNSGYRPWAFRIADHSSPRSPLTHQAGQVLRGHEGWRDTIGIP